MRTLRVLVLALTAGILADLVLAQAAPAPAGAPAAPPATTAPADLTPFLKAIREANTVAVAGLAYSQGCQVDRNNIELNRTYMRRALQLGQPQTAGTPAQALVNVGAHDGLSYAVMAYNCGKTNELPKALSYAVKSAELVKDDNSVENNLGQLVGWYHGAKTYKLPDGERQSLEGLEANLASHPAYAAAYQTIKSAYDKRAEANQTNQQKITAAQADVTDAQKTLADAQAEVTKLTGDIATHQNTLNGLQNSPTPSPGRRGGRPGPAPRRDDAAIQAEQKTLADLNTKLTAAKKTQQDAATALNRKKNALDAARAAARLEPVPLLKLFRWLPPAVDGVVTLPPDAASTGRP